MSGTTIGGKRAAKTNKEKHGEDFYRKIGAKGGMATGLKGFALNRELAKRAGAKGGRISRRTQSETKMNMVAEHADDIEKMYMEGMSLPQISRELGLSYATLYNWAKSNLCIYGVDDEIEQCEKILEEENGRA